MSEVVRIAELSLDDGIADEAALQLLVNRRGRPATPLHMAYSRDLTPADIEALAATPSTISPLKALRYPHHQLARLVAQGKKPQEISAITGYTVTRIDHLTNDDPMFRDLVAHYAEDVNKEFLDMNARIATLGATAVEMLQEKLEETPIEQLSIKTLKEVAEFAQDASGANRRANAPQGSGINISVNFVKAAPHDEPTPLINVTPQQQIEGPK